MSHKLCKQNISRLMAFLLAFLLVVSNAPAVSAAEGSCGSGLTWSLNGGTLTISGSGAMDDYEEGHMAPWYDLRSQITQLSLPEGLTHIGNTAFYGCESISSVSIPGSVLTIGEMAFSNCSGMTMLTLNSGLMKIGNNAFEKCGSLLDLRIPDTVISIGHHAFYFCTSLRYISLPGSVTSLGAGIFSYCHSLTQADIALPADSLPGWMFYGCEMLTTVNTAEGTVSASAMKVPNIPGAAVSETLPEPEGSTQTVSGNTTTNSQTVINPSGEIVTNDTVVKNTDNSTTVSTTTTTQNGETTTVQKEITSTVVNPDGWNDVLQQVEKTQTNVSDNGSGNANVTVYDAQSDIVTKEVLQELSGTTVSLNVQTQNGAQFKLDCTQLPEKVKKDLDLSYTLVPAEEIPEGMEGCTVYKLTFRQSTDLKVEMIMRLPGDHSYQTATLYQLKKKEPQQLQSVMVDADGNAHWYLRSIDQKTEYLIGINIPGAVEDSPIIPAELAGVQKIANVYDGVEYVVTGRKSSWNMGLGKVMAILAVVMVSTIVVVGFVIYFMNKQRLKNGYVPEWEDDGE